jgi:hypothetical protein
MQRKFPVNGLYFKAVTMKKRRRCRFFGSAAKSAARSPTPFPGWNADSCVMLNITYIRAAPND